MFSSISGSSSRMVLGKSLIIFNTETNWLRLIKKKKSIRFLKLIRKKSDVICKPYGLKTDFMESGPLEMPVLFKLLIPTLEGGFRA